METSPGLLESVGGPTGNHNVLTNNKSHALEIGCNVLLHVCFFSLFVCIFFFVGASRIEKSIVQTQIQTTVQELVQEIKSVIPPAERQALAAQIQSLSPPDMASADQAASANNKKLIEQSCMVLVPVFVLGIIIVVGSYFGYKKHYKVAPEFSLKQMFAHNGIVLGFVCLTELLFMLAIAANFKSLDPQVVKRVVVNSLLSFSTQ
jgi:hypothetical protein